MQYFCLALIYAFEAFIGYLFYENIYYRRSKISKSTSKLYIAYLFWFLVNFTVSLFSVAIANFIAFLVSLIILSHYCYESRFISCVFTSSMLSAFMMLTEALILLIASAFLHVEVYSYKDNLAVYVFEAAIMKILFLVIAYLSARLLFSKEKKQQNDKLLLILGILPVSSVLIIFILVELQGSIGFSNGFNIASITGTVLLLVANIVVFYIYDFLQRTNLSVTQLKLEKEREKARAEYYNLLIDKQENQSILIHDIKRHLSIIEAAAEDNCCESILDYVRNITTPFDGDNIRYSGNKIVDIIVNRYVHDCRKKDIKTEIEINCSVQKFINDADLTALLDNMFENAVESSELSKERQLYFSITKRNEHFVVINLTNSCDNPPKMKNGMPISSKTDKYHGFGTISMKKITEKYDGCIDWNFFENEKLFECEAVLKF